LQLLVARMLIRARDVLARKRIAALARLVHGAAGRAGALRPELSACAADGSPLRADPADLARWRGVAQLLLTAEGELRKRLTKNEGFPPQCADKLPTLDSCAELDRHPGARKDPGGSSRAAGACLQRR